ncbi:MAG: hypothetical protein ACK5YW_08715 [Betaproteobacteria bacterium]|jgi:hypothetical protein|nr:hypothetical protein [Rhodocyclaceae bacterium]MCA3134644.1 hypothetical protein [Rhodocyclaceae bacterium]MCA3143110.1 hypothetical protein [Rhodocyclaceae bacterium]MCA3144532.1 hypothetical protein [Rhodocyclaceae bacterium]MCE2898137.1 hypothetical protein [Betaproteobacteria bacterium]
MRVFLAHFLFVLAAWTLLIKFLFPVVWSVAYGEPLLAHVMWDFWWVAHLWLGWALLRRPSYLEVLAWLVAVTEIVIVVTKFALFLPDPQWTIWRTNWFINKVFVLAVFVLMAGWLVRGLLVREPVKGVLPTPAAPAATHAGTGAR